MKKYHNFSSENFLNIINNNNNNVVTKKKR